MAAIVVGVLLLAGAGYAAAKLTILKDTTVGAVSAQAGKAKNIPTRAGQASPGVTPSAVAVPVTTTPKPTPAPAVTPTTDQGSAAKAQLEDFVAKDAAGAIVRGQWVAQLSSKSEGVVDKTLQPGPFTIPDILAEHLRLRNDPSFGSVVRLVHLGDWGKVPTPASPMWVTVADANAASSAEAVTWCEAHFTQRGKALDNVCLPRQLTRKPG